MATTSSPAGAPARRDPTRVSWNVWRTDKRIEPDASARLRRAHNGHPIDVFADAIRARSRVHDPQWSPVRARGHPRVVRGALRRRRASRTDSFLEYAMDP